MADDTGVSESNRGQEILKRLGYTRESTARLGRKSSEAERAIGIHGVSVTASEAAVAGSSADRSLVEQYFPVHNTPTRADPLHRMIELPKPVTQEAADRFNEVFGRS